MEGRLRELAVTTPQICRTPGLRFRVLLASDTKVGEHTHGEHLLHETLAVISARKHKIS